MAAERNDDGLTFREWLAQASERVTERCGFTLSDLPDGDERNAWHDSRSPAEYANELLDEEGCPT